MFVPGGLSGFPGPPCFLVEWLKACLLHPPEGASQTSSIPDRNPIQNVQKYFILAVVGLLGLKGPRDHGGTLVWTCFALGALVQSSPNQNRIICWQCSGSRPRCLKLTNEVIHTFRKTFKPNRNITQHVKAPQASPNSHTHIQYFPHFFKSCPNK